MSSRAGPRTARKARQSGRRSTRTAKKTARKTTKSARKASRRPRKTTRKRKVQSAPTYKKTRNKVHITDRGAAKIKKNGKWIYVTTLLATGAALIGTGGRLWKREKEISELEKQISKYQYDLGTLSVGDESDDDLEDLEGETIFLEQDLLRFDEIVDNDDIDDTNKPLLKNSYRQYPEQIQRFLERHKQNKKLSPLQFFGSEV